MCNMIFSHAIIKANIIKTCGNTKTTCFKFKDDDKFYLLIVSMSSYLFFNVDEIPSRLSYSLLSYFSPSPQIPPLPV